MLNFYQFLIEYENKENFLNNTYKNINQIDNLIPKIDNNDQNLNEYELDKDNFFKYSKNLSIENNSNL